MKISKIYLAVLVLLPFTMNAQPVYQLGSNVVGFGLGVGGNFGLSSSYQSAPAINFQYEHGLKQVGPGVLSLGAYLGFKKYSYTSSLFGYTYSKDWKYTILGVRGAWHLQELKGVNLDKIDAYGGVMLSYNLLNYTYTDNDPSSTNYFIGENYASNVGITPFLGARYFFTNNFAGMVEFGYGMSYMNIGLAYKF